MTKRVRLPTERDLAVIRDNGLHEALVGQHIEDVRRALDALIQAFPGEVVILDLVVMTLARLLRAQDGVRALVLEVVALGSSPLDEEELFAALACWIIDSQIGQGFSWDPWTLPSRT
jgi:hypothetical protein